MTSGGRELLKWIALVLMTGDHVAKAFYGGYVPVVSEAGRIAFPLFALVMAYNLAQPGADLSKSIRRLALWAVIAQPVHALVFGYWIPLNVLATFALAAAAIAIASRRNWLGFAAAVGPAPLLVDYQWSGVLLVVGAWAWYDHHARYRLCRVMVMDWFEESKLYGSRWLMLLMLVALCLYNGNAWALLALPLFVLGRLPWALPRTRWAFYGYYVGHLALIAVSAHILAA